MQRQLYSLTVQLATLVDPKTKFMVPAGHTVQTVAPVDDMYMLAAHKVHEVAKLVEAE